jgi:excisionase family DNA binding protein
VTDQSKTIDPEFLTPAQVASLLQVRKETVRMWLRRGLMKGVKIGGKSWRIPRRAVEEFGEYGRPSALFSNRS